MSGTTIEGLLSRIETLEAQLGQKKEIKEMIVTTRYGSLKKYSLNNSETALVIEDAKGEIHLGLFDIDKKDPFAFYARTSTTPETIATIKTGEGAKTIDYKIYNKDTEQEESAEKFVHTVNIIMPLGGKESGFFRQPRVGEKVLVSQTDNAYFLLGFIPSTPSTLNGNIPQTFSTVYTEKVRNNDGSLSYNNDGSIVTRQVPIDEYKAQVLRYEKTGNNSEDSYSEIGFYHEATKWKPQNSTAAFPKIDTLKIKSTGDIQQKAENHNQIKAKRFELLVNCNGSRETDSDGAGYALGDRYGDDPNLYAGDAHIRAKNRIIIKAENEIVLEVGRSLIIINDAGIKIESRKTRSNVTSGWDTSVSLDAADGVTIAGQRIFAKAGIGFEVSEAYGGIISSQLGVTRMEGVDIRLSTMGITNYVKRGVFNALDLITNIALMVGGIASGAVSKYYSDAASDGFGHYSGKAGKFGGLISSAGIRCMLPSFFLGSIDQDKDATININNAEETIDYADTAGTLLSTINVIRTILVIVRFVAEFTIPERVKRERGEVRDGIYSVFAVIEFGVLVKQFYALATSWATAALHESAIHLRGKSQIDLDAKEIRSFGIKTERTESPLAALTKKSLWDKFMDTKTWVKPLIIGLGVVAGVGVGLGWGLGTNKANEKYEEELRRL